MEYDLSMFDLRVGDFYHKKGSAFIYAVAGGKLLVKLTESWQVARGDIKEYSGYIFKLRDEDALEVKLKSAFTQIEVENKGIEKLEAENKKLKEALGFYAEEQPAFTRIADDGEKAREVLR